MADDDARATALELLATPGTDTRFGDPYLPAAIRAHAGCTTSQAYEALWGLTSEGLAYLDPAGQRSGTDNWQWRLTAIGARAATQGTWEPADPAGFLRRLRHDHPTLDPSAITYLQEALRAFSSRCYLATAVMLGVAAEQVFLGMAEAFVASQPQAADKLGKMLTDPRSTYFQKFTELRKRLEPIRPSLPADLADTLTLDAVADLLRLTRNSAGHPSGATIDQDTARVHLQMAAVYLGKMTQLRDHLASVPGPGSPSSGRS